MAEVKEIKYTQKQMFEGIIKMANGESTTIPPHKIVEFAEKKLEQLNGKTSKVNDKKAGEQRAVMDMIIATLCGAEKPMKCGEIVKAVNDAHNTDYSASKINAMLRKLLPPDDKNPDGTGEVVRTQEKKDVFFSLA